MRLRRMWILTLSTFKNNQSSIFIYVIIKQNKLYYLKNKRWQAMKKIVSLLIIICSLLILVACSDDSSYTIDKVTIYAQINDAGHMNVQEVYTYTFDGEFNGMTRTIKSDASNFNAFLLPHDDHQSLGDPDAVDPLSIEVDDDTYKIHTASQDETKTVLYTYEVNGSIEKYQDIGKLRSEENTSELQSRFDLVPLFSIPTRRSSDLASNFNAFLLPHDDHQSLGDPDAVDPLSIEVDDDTYKIHTASQDETKTVLYTYEVNGSIEKYQDIGKL